MSAGSSAVDVLKVATPFITFGLGVVVERWGRLTRRIMRRPPVQVHVETDPRIIFANTPSNWVAAPMFVPIDPSELGEPPSLQAMSVRDWADSRGGLPCGFQELQVTLTAWQDLSVIVDSVRIEAVEIELPNGVFVGAQVGGASIERRRIEVALSTWAPEAKYIDVGGAQLADFSFQLGPGEIGRINIHAGIGDYDDDAITAYEWTVYLDLLVDNKRQSVTVDDGGKPFRLARHGARPMYLASPNGWDLQVDPLA